jgi:predicted GNAT family acetyltransferase
VAEEPGSDPPSNQGQPDISVAGAPGRSRYEVTVDGERAGFTVYLDERHQRIFFHTEIEERFAGRGLGSRLIAGALADTRAAGLRIVPVCPFVARYVERHHEVDDVLDPVTPAARAAVRNEGV